MKPPICYICDKRFKDDEGGLIWFGKRKSDIEWQERMERNKSIGHPPWAAWFCGDHYEEAKKLNDLTIDKALQKLRALFSS